MNRFSRPWWITLAFSSVTVATVAYFVLGQLTDWPSAFRILAAAGLAAVVDLGTANWMESVAPTHVSVGPGEKARITDEPSDVGLVVSGFDAARKGIVSIRGELWRARQLDDDADYLHIGNPVRIVGRSGLTLVVASIPD